MFHSPKSLALAVTRWIDGEDGEDNKPAWDMRDDDVSINFSSIFQMWQERERTGALPASGGWADQSLPLLSRLNVISLVFDTWNYKQSEGADWNKFTTTQLHLITWLENG